MAEKRILMGVVGRPHGVRGRLHVHSYTADPADLAGYGPLSDDQGRHWTLTWRGPGIAELRDAAGQPVTDRAAAERLTNLRLYLARALLPEPEPEEYYIADLVGMRAVAPDGAELGAVAAVHDYGGGVSLEIAGQGPPLLVPFTHTAVPVVEIGAGRLVVDPPVEVALPPGAKTRVEDAA